MQYKEVEGVLKYNTKTRNELLERNGGKYFMLDGQLEHPIGVAYDMRTRNIKHLTKEMPLQKFTIEDYSNYSDKIKFQYFNGIKELEVFNTSGFTGEDFIRWRGRYDEYITLDTGENGIINKNLGDGTIIYHKGFGDTVQSELQDIGKELYKNLAKAYNNTRPYIADGRSEDDMEANLLGGAFDGFDDNGKVRDPLSYKSRLGTRVYNVYGEGDVPTSVGYARTIEDRLSVGSKFQSDSNGDPMVGHYQTNEFSTYTHSINGINNLLKKTDELYNSHKIRTLFGRFHTSNDDDYNTYFESFDSAKIPNLGNPRGRGLLKLGVTAGRMYQTNGYDDPYCRAWTYHHQYSRVKDMIRPLPEINEEGKSIYEANVKYRSRINNLEQGGRYLHENTVLQDTGFVRITPSSSELSGKMYTAGGDYKFNNPKEFSKLKKYMFSIENLAWGDGTSNNTRNLSSEQLGPNNGRIMWFPPYNLDFKENVNVKWNSQEFIGRGENIYTYSNTTRKATLSFTILIDHPALLNSMASGKYDGEEPDKDPENDILRFFAGCQTPDPDKDVPETAPPDIRNAEKAEHRIGGPKPIEEPNVEEKPTVEENPESIVFYVFFPNNYSGMWNLGNNLDSADKTTSRENAFMESGYVDKDWYEYLIKGSNAGSSGVTEGNGYEMYIEPDSNTETYNWKGLTTNDDNPDVIKSLSINEDADYLVERNRVKNPETNKEKWFRYRVDYDLRQSGLKTASIFAEDKKSDSSYEDRASFGLNNSLEVLEKVGKGDANYTFYDVFSALFDIKSKEDSGITNDTETGTTGGTESRIAKLKKIFSKDSGNIINSITFIGGATRNDEKNSQTLAIRRGKTVVDTVKRRLEEIGLSVGETKGYFSEITNTVGNTSTDVGRAPYPTINSKNAKAERYARIEIKYNASKITNAANTDIDPTKLSDRKNDEEYLVRRAEFDKVKIDDEIAGILLDYYGGDYEKVEEHLKDENIITYAKMKRELKNLAAENDMAETYTQFLEDEKYKDEILGDQSLPYKIDLLKNEITKLRTVRRTVTSIDEIAAANTNIRRYDDEYRFFRRLEKESPLIFKKIVDKVKYFNPAFHSLSPEGFNARLTFLQQCTRQGHTVSASESTNLGLTPTAGNLSFGKMPVCVLRIGDFINTRIVIESMSIDYKNGDIMQWDLNPEGAGVQPMLANITLSVVLLGGQSLDGPINRLQNAVTFNYYANAPVYDDRADRIVNNYDGTITYKHLFTPFKEGEF